MTDALDSELLAQFARNDSEAAFAELVHRYLALVHSVALRHTANPQHAEDITQAVFIILARKAGALGHLPVLAGWLYHTARLTAANYRRAEMRRIRREQEAFMQPMLAETVPDAVWRELAPQLDAAMACLGGSERDALVLRYFQNKSMAEVGKSLGMEENTAQKQVGRALEKLRKFFNKRGIALSVAAIAGAVSANCVQAAPAVLAQSVTIVSVAKGATAGSSTLTLVKGALKLMAWTKAKTAVASGVVLVLVAGTTTVVVERNASRANDAAYEEIFKHLDTDPASSVKLDKLSPTLVVRPTQYPNGGVGLQTPAGKGVVVNTSIEEMIRHAYGFTTSARMVLPKDLPEGQFDYLNSLADHQREALRAELKKRFGLVAHAETLDVDALLLKVKDPAKLRDHLARHGNPGPWGTFKLSRGMANEAITGFESMQLAELLETIFQKPVVDRSGSDSLYEWKSKSEINPAKTGKSREDAWLITIDQLGLELVPTNMPVEMLVVEKTK